MAVPMTYTSLIQQIKDYANRTDDFFVSVIPDLIQQAMSRIYSEADNIGFEKVVKNNTFFITGQAFITKPADWKETISIQYTIDGPTPYTSFLLPRTYEFCINYWPNQNPLNTAPPMFYASYGNQLNNNGLAGKSFDQFYIAPTPDQNYPGQIIYLSRLLFNEDNPTNFLTLRYPNLLLYACMMEAIPLLKDDERVPVFESLYNRALQNINRDTKERYTDRTTKRNKD